jgi:hypothetical protein
MRRAKHTPKTNAGVSELAAYRTMRPCLVQTDRNKLFLGNAGLKC